MNRYVLAVMLALYAVNGIAGHQSALEIVQGASDAILERLDEDRNNGQMSPTRVEALISEILLPHIDAPTMARHVLDEFWGQASEEQRNRFVAEFTDYMVRFYVQVFMLYEGEAVSYSVDGGDASADRRIVTSLISQSRGGSAVKADYVVLRRDGVWRVADIVVDGVSMVTSNRSQFRHLILRDGIEQVIGILNMHNSRALR